MTQYPQPFFEYIVRSGDTHASLARRFGVAEEALRAQTGELTPGVAVKISCPAGVCRKGAFYALRRGDTLRRVAERAGVTMRCLLEVNPYLNPGYYVAGQVIMIPAARDEAGTYTLRPGERLFDVLRRLRVDISTFCSLNPGVRLMDIKPGQTVKLPRGAPGGGEG
ncbi:MAG: LysM peptidoglycan-binding domain-containing protein [Bacillota bacterium]